MTYTNNVPQGSQRIADTQPLIQGNFGYLDTAMKINHAWNGNQIAAEAPGSHQKLSMPNQGADITGALPTGIAAIMYAIGGNLFTWNGAKNPLSGVSGAAKVVSTPAVICTPPKDSIGIIIYSNNLTPTVFSMVGFMTSSITSQTNYVSGATFNPFSFVDQTAGSSLRATGGATINYKYIYWPI